MGEASHHAARRAAAHPGSRPGPPLPPQVRRWPLRRVHRTVVPGTVHVWQGLSSLHLRRSTMLAEVCNAIV